MKPRFVTYRVSSASAVECMTEAEFAEFKASPEFTNDWDEWVWQYADSKAEAIANHDAKLDAWHVDPTKATY